MFVVCHKQIIMDKSAAEQFIEVTETTKNSRISILDLRGNGGGIAYYVTRWLNLFAFAFQRLCIRQFYYSN